MNIAAKHFDPLVGIDTHITLVPTPAGPVPTPLPQPYVGMIFDVMDYVPVLGTKVFINGLPRAQAGTAGRAMPPHLPLAGPFAKPPTNESEVFMGSSTVLVEGEPQSYFGLPALSCQDIGMPAPPRVKRKSTPKSLLLGASVCARPNLVDGSVWAIRVQCGNVHRACPILAFRSRFAGKRRAQIPYAW